MGVGMPECVECLWDDLCQMGCRQKSGKAGKQNSGREAVASFVARLVYLPAAWLLLLTGSLDHLLGL